MNSDRPPTQWPMAWTESAPVSPADRVDRGRPVAHRDVVDGELGVARLEVRAGAVVEQPDVVAVLAEVLHVVLGHGVDRERARGVAVAGGEDDRALRAHRVVREADLGAVGRRHGDALSAGGRVIAPPGPRSAVAGSIRSSLTRGMRFGHRALYPRQARSKAKWTGDRPERAGENPTDGCRAISAWPCKQPWTGSSDSSRVVGDSFWASGSCLSSPRCRSPRSRPSTSPQGASRCPARARRRSPRR